MPCAVDGCGMLSIISFCAECKVICGGKSPTPFIAARVSDNVETEILAVVIFIVGKVIEKHPPVHLLHIHSVLGKKACKREKVGVIHKRLT